MSGIADIVRALGGPRLVPAKSPPGSSAPSCARACPTRSLVGGGGGFRSAARTRSRSSGSPPGRWRGASASGGSRPRSRTGWSAWRASPRWPRRCWAAEKASRWLTPRNRGAGRRRPLSQLDTDLGAEEVEDVLLRLAHGVVGERLTADAGLAHLQARARGLRRRGRAAGGRALESPRRAVVYASERLSLAALELLVHADPALLPEDLVAIAADVPETVRSKRDGPRAAARLAPPSAPRRRSPSAAATGRRARDRRSCRSLGPRAREQNFLLNPAHADFRKIRAETRPRALGRSTSCACAPLR